MFSNMGPWQLVIILVIVIMIFGTKKLRSLGGDLGSAVKGFKKAMDNDGQSQKLEDQKDDSAQTSVKTEEKQKDSV